MQYGDERGKIFIGGLSWDTTHASMLKYFSRYGEVIDCVVMKNPSTGKSRGFGFVTYKDPACVEIVLSSGPHVLDDRQIDPKACNPRSLNKVRESGGKNLENSKKKIFIGGLPANITEAQLRDHFSKYGTVIDVVIMYDQQKERSRGFGFLTFESEETVDSVVKEHFIQINGKQVEVKKAEPRDLKMIAEGTTAAFLVTPGFPGSLSLLPSPLGGSIAFPGHCGQAMLTAGTVPGNQYPALPVSAAWCSPAGQGLRLVSPNSPIMLIAPSGGRGPGPIGPGGLAYSSWAPQPGHNEMSGYSLNSSPASYDTPLQSPAYGSLVSSDLGHLYAINNGAFGLMGGAGSLNELEKGSPAYHVAVGGYGLGLGNGLAGSLLSSGPFASQSSEAVLPPGFFTTASPSLGYGRIPTNHASISPGFHPYRR